MSVIIVSSSGRTFPVFINTGSPSPLPAITLSLITAIPIACSKITNKYIKHPSEILSVGDIVDCYVDEIKLDKKKVSLSLLDPAIEK